MGETTRSLDLGRYAVLLLLGLTFMCGAFFLSVKSAFAAAPTMTAVTADTNDDGTIDRITITFSEASLIVDGDAGNGLPSLALSGGCTIANADYATASTTTLTLSSLTGCTSLNTALMPTITYTPVASCVTANAICDAAAANQMAGGTPNATSTDGAKPIVVSITKAHVADGFNTLTILYSEAVTASIGNVASTSNLGDLTVAGTLAGFGSYSVPGDVTVATTKNTISGSGTDTIGLSFASQTGAFLAATSTTEPSGTFTPAVAVTDTLHDAAGLSVNTTHTVSSAGDATWDLTKPTVANTYSCASDVSGKVKRMQVNAGENIRDASVVFANFEVDNDVTNSGTGEEVPASYNTATAGCDGAADDTDANDQKIRFDLTTGIAGTELAYLHMNTLGLADMAGNLMALGDALGTENDKAAPLLTSSTPANGATGVLKTDTITLVFSEAIASLTASLNTGATLTNSTTLPAATVVLTSTKASGTNILTIASAPDAAANAYGGAATGASSPLTFYVATSSSSTTGSSTISHEVSLDSPVSGSSYASGSSVPISWLSGSGVGTVNLSYSLDGGVTYASIATSLTPNGNYTWTAPNVSGAVSASIKAEGFDASTVVSTAFSGNFSIVGTGSSSSSDTSSNTTGETNSDVAGTNGINPFNGDSETISAVSMGDYIYSPSASTVYYVDAGLVRRPFMDYQTYRTYSLSSNITLKLVTDATMPTMDMGSPMLPKAGVVLVKVQSDAHVYALTTDTDGNTELHWVNSESAAQTLYGSAWADYVIDVQSTLFAHFTTGSDYTGSESVDRGIMRTRNNLNS